MFERKVKLNFDKEEFQTFKKEKIKNQKRNKVNVRNWQDLIDEEEDDDNAIYQTRRTQEI